MLHKMVSKTYGGGIIFPIKPQFVFFTDDTVVDIFERKGLEKDKFTLIRKRSLKLWGNQLSYIIDESDTMKVMRVKLTFTFNAA